LNRLSPVTTYGPLSATWENTSPGLVYTVREVHRVGLRSKPHMGSVHVRV